MLRLLVEVRGSNAKLRPRENQASAGQLRFSTLIMRGTRNQISLYVYDNG